MFRNSYNRFFPTPTFLSAPSFGMDVSDESIKYVELRNTRNGIRVGRYGEHKIPLGIIESGKIKDSKKMEEILKSLRKEQSLTSVRVSLPEEQIYLFKLRLEKANTDSIYEAIELSLEEHVPIPAPDVIFDFDLINEDEKSFEIEVAAIPKNVIETYLSIFEHSEISVPSFELEAQAIARAVIKKDDPGTYMIVDFGDKRTGISVVSHGVVLFTSTLDIGGVMLTKLIEKSFKISFAEAEKMKRQYGLQRNASNKEMFSVLLNGVSILRDEIAKHYTYWHTHKDEEGKDRPTIQKILLCGGDSNLIGLSDYFSVSMRNSVELANVWVNFTDISKYIPDIKVDDSLSFATAIGLALGDFEHD